MSDDAIPLLGLATLIWLIAGPVAGRWFGKQRNRPDHGMLLGLLLGPFGWLLTLLLPPGATSQGETIRCPTCGGALAGRYEKCQHCASAVFWVGIVPTKTAEEAAEEQERQERDAIKRRERGAYMAAERQRQHEEELERQRETLRQSAEEAREAHRRWEERNRKALRWGEERSRATLIVLVFVARWLLRRADGVLRGFTRHRRNMRVRRVLVPARGWRRQADRALRGWSRRLATLNEAGMRRCLWLVLAIVLILVLLVGVFAMSGDGGKQTEPIRGADRQDRDMRSTADAPDVPRFRYNVTDLGTLGGETSEANGINDAGQVVGAADTRDGHRSAFLWQSGKGMQNLGGPVVITGPMTDSEIVAARKIARELAILEGSGTSDRETAKATLIIAAGNRGFVSRATAISDKGYVVGRVRTTKDGETHAFLWTPRRGMRILSARGESDGEAVAVNDREQVAGMHHLAGELGRAFFWEDESGMQDIGGSGYAATAMNDAGQVVGLAISARAHSLGHAFLWHGRKGMQDLGDLRGGAGSTAWAINRKCQVVGVSCGFDFVNHRPLPDRMFLWQADKGMQDLGVLTPEARPYSINNLGQIVGGAFEQHFRGSPPFLYSDGKMIDLNTMIDRTSGWCLITATGINDSGQIVGKGKNKAGQSHAILLTPVPNATLRLSPNPPRKSTAETPAERVQPENRLRDADATVGDKSDSGRDGKVAPKTSGGAKKKRRGPQAGTVQKTQTPRKRLTKAQEEQIRLRLQSLYAALYSLPTSGPVDQLPNMMQQRYGLTAEIAELEAQLGDTAEPKER